MSDQRRLPLSQVTLVFGAFSIPLAFARHLCVPAAIMAMLAIMFHLWGGWMLRRGRGYSPQSLGRSSLGVKLALVGGLCALIMWVLWTTNTLLQ
jgi:hypothetical protein